MVKNAVNVSPAPKLVTAPNLPAAKAPKGAVVKPHANALKIKPFSRGDQ